MDVSAQPPWSIATSASTDPSFIPETISRVISFGASAPGMSTAPMTRSDSATDSSICSAFDISSVTREPSTSSRWRMRSIERSRIVTSAPSPSAMTAAL